jgi:HEAT repeat protein
MDASGEYESGYGDEHDDHDDDHGSSAQPAPNPELDRIIQLAAIDGGRSLKDDPELAAIGKKTSTATKVGLAIFAGILLIVGGWAAYTQKRAFDEQALFDQIAAMTDREAQLAELTKALPEITNEDLKVRILRNLGHFRYAPAVPVLTEHVGYGGLVRRHAAAALARIGSPAADPAKARLFDVLELTDVRDRAQVVWTLAVLREPRASDAILDAFRSGLISKIEGYDPRIVAEALGPARLSSDELIKHEDGSVRVLTAHALAESNDPSVIDPLIRLLEAEIALEDEVRNAEVLRSAAAGLGRIGNERAAAPLFKALESGAGKRRDVLDALSQAVAGPALARLLMQAKTPKDRLDLARLAADTHDPRVGDALAAQLDQPELELRLVAAHGLAAVGDPRGQDLLLEVAGSDDHTEARRALAMLRITANAEATGRLLKLMEARPGRKADIMNALGNTGDPAASKALFAELDGDDGQVAAMALANLNDGPTYAKLLKMAPRPQGLDLGAVAFADRRPSNDAIIRQRRGVIRALGRFGRPEALPILTRIVEDGSDDYELRASAAEAVGQLANAEQMRTILSKMSSNEVSRAAKGYYIQALWQRAHPELHETLLNIVGGNEPSELRRAAAIAVGYSADPRNDARLITLLGQERTAQQAALAISLGGGEDATRKLVALMVKDEDIREVVREPYLNADIRWFNGLTKDMFENGSVWRRLRTAAQLKDAGDQGYGFAWKKITDIMRLRGDGPNAVHPIYVREQLWTALNGDDEETRLLAAKALYDMKERGILLRARDEGGRGGDTARLVLDAALKATAE